MIKRVLFVIAVVGLLGVGGRYLPLDFLRPSLERAMQRGFGRKIEIGQVHLNLFGPPGFTLEQVTIYDDPRAGIEPFAYADSVNADIRYLSLLQGHVTFSNLSLGDAAINLVRTPEGPWNFQFLLENPGDTTSVPSIRIRGGRVNLKFGDTKSVFYFDDADLDLSTSRDGTVNLRFGGAPSRTDRPARDFGHLFVRGGWTRNSAPAVSLQVELERSSLDELVRMVRPYGIGLDGVIALEAQLSGPPDRVQVTGNLEVAGVHRTDLLPMKGSWGLGYTGMLNLHNDTIDLAAAASSPNPPLTLRVHGEDLLSQPRWQTEAQLREAPLTVAVDMARRMGAAVPDKLTSEGTASGNVAYDSGKGFSGRVEFSKAAWKLPEQATIQTPNATVSFTGNSVRLEPATVQLGDTATADVEGSCSMDALSSMDLRVSTKGMNLADLRPYGALPIPLLQQTPQGTWRGVARYKSGEWSGEFEMQNARVPVDGMADSLKIQTATVLLSGKRVSVSRLRASAGEISFTGDYRWDPESKSPHQFHIAAPEADGAEIWRLLSPLLDREQGFFARTLGLGGTQAPDWLKDRKADGTISIAALKLPGIKSRLDQAHLVWDGLKVELADINAHSNQTGISGTLTLNLEGRAPQYTFSGKVGDLPYKGGSLDFDGKIETSGSGAQAFASAHAQGTVRGRSVAFSPEAQFRAASATFEVQGLGAAAKWKLSDVEVSSGGGTWSGAGGSQPDGSLALDLTSGKSQWRVTGPLVTPPPSQP